MKSLFSIKSSFVLLMTMTILLSTYCKKEYEDNVIIINESIVFPDYDSILFHDYNPDISITATRYYGPDSFNFCNNTPTPTDSIALYQIDVNKDMINDFEVSVERWKYVGQGSSYTTQPCLRYKNFRTIISSLNDSNNICIKSYMIRPNEFKLGDLISKDSIWGKLVVLYINSVQSLYSFRPSNPQFYLGLRVKKGYGYYYGWLIIDVSEDQLIIKEMAINLIENRRIFAGQKL